jgi:hypothetical protein
VLKYLEGGERRQTTEKEPLLPHAHCQDKKKKSNGKESWEAEGVKLIRSRELNEREKERMRRE